MANNVFVDVKSREFTPEQAGGLGFSNLGSMQIGEGSQVFRGDRSGIWLGANTFADAPFSVDMSGNLISTTATITGYARGFVSTLAWTATDADTASWASGTIKTSDGTSYAIDSGNTGNIAATTYVYLDPDTSITVLQKTTTATTAVGDKIILVAIVQEGAAGSGCIIDVVGSHGTTVDGDRITTGKIESSDGKTYFDLDNDRIIVNDSSHDRILIGYQSGGF